MLDRFRPLPAPRAARLGRPLIMLLLAGSMLAGLPMAGHADTALNSQAAGPASSHVPDFADLVNRVRPAVVSITTKMDVTDAADEEGNAGPGLPHGMPFGLPFGMPGARPHGSVQARGSGFIIDASGTVVTNNHVVKNAKSISVLLSDGTELPAKLVGTDPRTDIAVLKVKADHALPFVALGDSGSVRPGQWVVAMGNPFGLGGSVTAGIVSALGRDIGSGPYDDFIQVDAPINQGNSGGPLFTQDGEVVGINTAILSPSGGSVGIGFAIPSAMVREVTQQLLAKGSVTRGYLGVESQKITPSMAAALHLPKSAAAGALVASVEADSPAAQAGVQPGDVILQVGEAHVSQPRDLALAVASAKPGSSVKLSVLRDGTPKDLDVTLASLKPEQTARADEGGDATPHGIGVALGAITPDVRDQLDLPKTTKGVVVAGVRSGSAAEQAGLSAGDVIQGVGNHEVTTPEDAAKAIRRALENGHGTGSVALRVLRDGQSAFVAINPGDAEG